MSSMNSMRLRELIRSVRKCKTADEERSLINRECAVIKEGFQENTPYLRTRCMLKLLYVRMLGYSTEFGQLEVVNLLAQSDFSGKRIGYLALQLLIDETDEVLTLAENHMKNDMGGRNALHQVVALNAAANIASEDMCRDVFDDVMRIIDGRHGKQIKAKACLTAVKIVRKVPEQIEYFLEKFTGVFNPECNGYMLCALTLVNYCLQTREGASFIPTYRKLATAAVRVLKSFVLSARITEQDVCGITDPFLQVKILEFMRIIGQGSAVTSEALNDVLAQVITNTDASRNVGCAIHYECVRTINTIESDDGLRLLAVNTISRFLSSSRDNNLRVVALKTLLDYAHTYGDLDTVQQHRETIIECMRDPDVSIRRRALELTVALVTEDNVRLMVPDLLQYLTLCSNDMREETTTHICRIIEEKSPGDEWRVELSLKVLKVSKQHAKVDFAKRLVGILSQQKEDVQATSVKFLWDEASFPFDAIHHARKAFMVAALWSIGEYCDLLTTKYKVTPQEVVTCLVDITNNTPFPLLKQYGLTAMMKTATKFPAVAKSALSAMSSHLSSLDCELQQRASEYATLLKDFPEDAKFCFAKMPPICPAPRGRGEARASRVRLSGCPTEADRHRARRSLWV
ncbi:AP-1 complex subunit gamma-1 [Angomonas deanei]|nr:AP-1 complex subunit gamma-1 [Angomonas deanei]|eukprot:EPY26953.1 AP-1 complex subunit gamma-1 [Angomonas deanei]